MKRSALAALLLAAFAVSTQSQESPSQAASAAVDSDVLDLGEYRNLKVLYAGYPGGSRETVWMDFLQKNFDEVEAIDLQELGKVVAEPYDVIVADWTSQYGNDGYSESDSLTMPRVNLGAGFEKPVVCVSSVASSVAPRSKLDWL